MGLVLEQNGTMRQPVSACFDKLSMGEIWGCPQLPHAELVEARRLFAKVAPTRRMQLVLPFWLDDYAASFDKLRMGT
jgi:hypothetical protein